MVKTELKTQKNDKDVDAFLATIADKQQQADCIAIRDMMKKVTKEPGAMWGASIVGFGSYRYRYASGREGDWMKIGFSPRNSKTTLYLLGGFENLQDQLDTLGPHDTGKGCLYIKHLADVNHEVLQAIISKSYKLSAFVEV